MAAKQYGSTGNYQVVWVNGQWLITNDSEFAAADVVSIDYEIDAAGGGISIPIVYHHMSKNIGV